MRVIINQKYKWHCSEGEGIKLWWIGSRDAARKLFLCCSENPTASMAIVERALCDLRGNYSAILEQKNRVIAAVDRIRSFPVFYSHGKERFLVSNSARDIRRVKGLHEVDPLSLLEFRMAGYVTGGETLYRNLHQLQAGEFLIWEGEGNRLKKDRYYLFHSGKVRNEREEDLIEELDDVTDRIFSRVADAAAGAPIWVPLSGGLDSRLVLCKLKQLGYSNLTAFSYGPPGNHEARAARYVAAKVGVPWVFLVSKRKSAIRFFNSRTRRLHWEFADGLCSLPFYQDIQTLWENKEDRVIPEDAIIINGNSGDFITGGHVPRLDGKTHSLRVDDLLTALVDKHFSLRSSLKVPGNVERIKGKILDSLKLESSGEMSLQDLAKHWERWEWQERQSKFVVNGQRNYDFFGFSWKLPLWDDEYLYFWNEIPVHLKLNQELYKRYLFKKDFFGLFRSFPFRIWRWPGASIAVVPAARAVKVLFGGKASDRVYRVFSYWGHYRDSYAYNGYWHFLKNCFDIKNPNSLFVDRWLQEEGLRNENSFH